jgi:hypothetical protein
MTTPPKTNCSKISCTTGSAADQISNSQECIGKTFRFPIGNDIPWCQDFMCYRDNIPGEIDFLLCYFINHRTQLACLRAKGYGFQSLFQKDYGNGAISADLVDILPYMRD